jgi:hypothetical protein
MNDLMELQLSVFSMQVNRPCFCSIIPTGYNISGLLIAKTLTLMCKKSILVFCNVFFWDNTEYR